MEVSNLHGGMVRRSRDTDVTSSGAGKRRRLDSEDQKKAFHLQCQSQSDLNVNFHENVILTAVSGVSDHVSSFLCSINDDLRSDLKAKSVSETRLFTSSSDDLSRETSTSSVVSLESEELMESLSTSTPKRKKSVAANEATSRRKPSPPEKSPSPAELEEFFSEAEKYEQKRFAEKYNYDIVRDVPMEGRYQWFRLHQ